MADQSDLIAAAHREAVKAVKAAFGAAQRSEIAPVAGGASGAFPFRADLDGRRFLVRVEGVASPLRNPHQYQSMRIAAQAGIAPKLHYVDEAARVAVMDFVEERPLCEFPGGPQRLAHAIGKLLGRVQATSPFPPFVQYPIIVTRLWAWVCQTGLFAPGVLDPHTERLCRIRDAYVWDAGESVSSHNDPVPRNILFDGDRLWLIDWESAYQNDPLVDVAITLDSFAPSPDLESALLQAWLGREPAAPLLRRLIQVRALTRLYYAGVFLSASAAACGPLADQDVSVPTLVEFQQARRDGQIQPGSSAANHLLGKMYLASFMTGDVPPGLGAAV